MWTPDHEELEYLRLVISMSTDCILGKGTETLAAYTQNLKIIANHLEDTIKPTPSYRVEVVCKECGKMGTVDICQ